MMLEAFVLAIRLFVRWFIAAFFAWVIKSTFDAAISPWLERPLQFIANRSRMVRQAFGTKIHEIRVAYSEFDMAAEGAA